ncbi:MAG: polysaccharide deacetylase family protein [Candidatus Omnitrophica bacterium]|nr:polysaccharide deacetylase family protein [Candidatus Omnitrophota bacterium]
MSRWAYHLPILAYHRVGPFRADHVPTVSAEAFERQLELLARFQYRVLPLEDLISCLDRGERLPRRSVVITFDDGYAETHTVAWPLLKRFGYPAAVFVAPGEVGRAGFATWEQLAELARDGIAVGSHTMHHSYVPLLSAERLQEEFRQSKAVIESRIGRVVQCLSYPSGGFTPQAQAAARAAGYLAACTTNRSLPGASLDRWALRRIKMTERDAQPLRLLAKVSGHYDCFRRLKRPN